LGDDLELVDVREKYTLHIWLGKISRGNKEIRDDIPAMRDEERENNRESGSIGVTRDMRPVLCLSILSVSAAQ